MIPVSKPFLPPQQIYQSYLDGIWKRQWLTNMGPLANDLELKLKDLALRINNNQILNEQSKYLDANSLES